MAQWNPRVNEIFVQAIEADSPSARAAVLEVAFAAEPDLRGPVEALLRAHDQAGSFLGSPPAATSDHTPDPDPTVETARQADETLGTMIGPYKLLRKIGEGGMGSVFMAEQEKPVRRKVALKVIKAGMDTAQVVARFEAERQALAIMDHQNIARVLDAGATETCRPYFVMELVKGVPITEYCDQNNLSPKERLALFIPVCEAIQHAHQKGIIHRDIKPTNVLVTLYDGKPVPKVIDFGVAKAIEQRLTEKTMFTQHGAVVGTLEYMSPEQAETSALDIDTRSDIYSLGVLLYELLTGSTPLEREQLRKAAYNEILRRIREEEPPKPSTRLSTTEELRSIAVHRKTEPARLSRLMRGELDWIVMKALEKDRTRRYETATGFAKDVQRYLDGDPVEAGPPSASYKLRKFARKHRAVLATVGAFAFLLVAATAISAGLAVWANRERVRAGKAEKAAKVQKGRAEEREQMAIDAVKRFGDVIRETPELKNNPSLSKLRATLLREPHAFFKKLRDRLQSDRETTPGSLARLATASFDLGTLTDEIGDKQNALRAVEESREILERLARGDPTATRIQVELAQAHNTIGKLQSETGEPAEALASLERARAIRERLARANPSATQFQTDLAGSHNNIGLLQGEMGRPTEALASHERARAIRERLARASPSTTEFRIDLGASHYAIGNLQRATGRSAEALASYERAREIFERLARDNSSASEFRTVLAGSHDSIGVLQGEAGRPAEALASYERAREIFERLVREYPSVIQFQRDLARSYNNIGVLLDETGKPTEALEAHEQARVIRERLARENPSVTTFLNDLAISHNNISVLQNVRGLSAEALASLERARAIRERLAREHPDRPDFASGLGATLNNMGRIDLDQRRFDEAREKLTQAIEWQRKALTAYPYHPTYRQFLASHLTNLIRAAEGLNRADEARQARRELAELNASDPAKAAVDARLAVVLDGQAPNDDAERLRLANRAYERALHITSTRLFAEALANAPKLGDDRQLQHRYNAACAASLAASGKSKDDPPPDDAARVKLRRQALDWLKAELSAWKRVAMTIGPGNKETVAATLKLWTEDADLAGIRDEKELAKLSEQERATFRALWSDVDRLLSKVGSRK